MSIIPHLYAVVKGLGESMHRLFSKPLTQHANWDIVEYIGTRRRGNTAIRRITPYLAFGSLLLLSAAALAGEDIVMRAESGAVLKPSQIGKLSVRKLGEVLYPEPAHKGV